MTVHLKPEVTRRRHRPLDNDVQLHLPGTTRLINAAIGRTLRVKGTAVGDAKAYEVMFC